MAASEDQTQAIVGFSEQRPRLGFEKRKLLPVACLPPEPVDGVALCRRGQPGSGTGWNSVPAPSLQRTEQCVLHDVLGDVEVAEQSRQGGGEPAGFLTEDRAQGNVGRLRLRTPQR